VKAKAVGSFSRSSFVGVYNLSSFLNFLIFSNTFFLTSSFCFFSSSIIVPSISGVKSSFFSTSVFFTLVGFSVSFFSTSVFFTLVGFSVSFFYNPKLVSNQFFLYSNYFYKIHHQKIVYYLTEYYDQLFF